MARRRTWTDEELRAAVTASHSVGDLLRQLGLSDKGGGSRYALRRRIRELGIDTSHFSHRSVDSDLDRNLRGMVPKCKNLDEVLDGLGLAPTAANYDRVQRRIALLGIRHDGLFREQHSGTRSRGGLTWTDEQLKAAVATSRSYAQAIRTVGLIPAGGNYDQIQRRIKELGIDTTHFTGKGWNVGRQFDPRPARPLSDVLVYGRRESSHTLKKRLFREGLKKPACELCGWAERSPDGRVPVELDHINGDKLDNRLENLRIVCPNCHALQPTHRGLNKRSYRATHAREPSIRWCPGRDSNPHAFRQSSLNRQWLPNYTTRAHPSVARAIVYSIQPPARTRSPA